MKRTFLVALVLVGCGEGAPASVSRERITYAVEMVLPYGKLHPSFPGGDSLSVRWASHYLKAMDEPRLDPQYFEYDVYRFTYMPAFQPTVALRLMRRPTGCLYVRKEIRAPRVPEGSVKADPTLRAWAQPLRVSAVDSVPVGRLECAVIVKHMAELRLGVAPEPRMDVVPDGATWLFEEIRDGRYNAREVSSPDSLHNAAFYNAGATFVRVARYAGDGFPARPTTFPY